MSNVLAGLGLQPDPDVTGAAPVESQPPAQTAPAAPEAEPAAPAPQAAVTPDDDEDIAVPEGAENPDAVRSLIRAERAAARQAYARARDAEARLAAIEEAGKPVEERLALATKRAEDAALEAMRLRVGFKHGLDVTLAERLKGNDEASLTQDAQSLLQALGSKATPAAPQIPGGLNGGPTPPPVQPADPGQSHNNLLLTLAGRRPGA